MEHSWADPEAQVALLILSLPVFLVFQYHRARQLGQEDQRQVDQEVLECLVDPLVLQYQLQQGRVHPCLLRHPLVLPVLANQDYLVNQSNLAHLEVRFCQSHQSLLVDREGQGARFFRVQADQADQRVLPSTQSVDLARQKHKYPSNQPLSMFCLVVQEVPVYPDFHEDQLVLVSQKDLQDQVNQQCQESLPVHDHHPLHVLLASQEGQDDLSFRVLRELHRQPFLEDCWIRAHQEDQEVQQDQEGQVCQRSQGDQVVQQVLSHQVCRQDLGDPEYLQDQECRHRLDLL